MIKRIRNLFGLITLTALGFCLGCTPKKQAMNVRENNAMLNPVIAHRGAWKQKQLPQNSIASLKEAINLKCGGTEFDVHLTADDVLVVNHDHDFYGLDVEKSTYQQLLTKKHANGESIPTAEEYLKEGLKQGYTKLIFELKASRIAKSRTITAAEMSASLVKRLDKNALMVEFISFDYAALKKIKELIPNTQVAYLDGNVAPKKVKTDGLTGLDYHLSIYKKNPTWLKDAQKLGLTVNVWTVNNKEDMVYFLDKGTDYITTDSPGLLLELLKNRNHKAKE